MGARIASFANLLPNARIVAHQSGWQWSARCEESHPGAVVAVGVDGGHVFHLLEAIHLILWVLQQTQNNNVNWYFFKNGRYRSRSWKKSWLGFGRVNATCGPATMEELLAWPRWTVS